MTDNIFNAETLIEAEGHLPGAPSATETENVLLRSEPRKWH